MASPWHYLPVEVPAGTAALLVTLSYARDGGAVLDLGCFRPLGFGGWSGGARSSFVISPLGATPGYLAGDVVAGLWRVAIGLYKVPAEGVRYEVTAEAIGGSGWARRVAEALAADGVVVGGVAADGVVVDGVVVDGVGLLGRAGRARQAPAERPGRRSLPSAPGRTWLAGDLHAHTVHSDGAMTVPELASQAVARGLDFLAVTDHNTVSHHRELAAASAAYGITLVPGQEVTTSRGHAGVLGDTGWIDFKTPADSWLAAAERGGGLIEINHPFGGGFSWLHAMDAARRCSRSGTGPGSTRPGRLRCRGGRRGIRGDPVGGSDWHRPGSDSPLGTPTTWVECDDDSGVAGVLEGLRAGRVAIHAARNGPICCATTAGSWPSGGTDRRWPTRRTVPADRRRRRAVPADLATIGWWPGWAEPSR